MEWTEELIARLRGLWDEGHSTAEIGRRMGISKNAVVGKAHRLSLPARPSPIKRDAASGQAAPAPARRISGPTLPCLAAAEETPPVAPVVTIPAATPSPRPAPVLRAVPPAPRPAPRAATCCWPIGEPGTPSFRFCDQAAAGGRPYCGEHAQIAYVRVRDRREDAA
ncbi:MAG TPA: GcrA family cell cycle regulator [Acetobacteraceae bacterium]|nr:GcrA family cell cycle regulator [Acetobacteraceae bacterium]